MLKITLLRVLQGHSGWIRAIAISPDGGLAVTASKDRSLIVWELATGRNLRNLRGHRGEVNDVVLTADGRWALSAAKDKTVRIWDMDAASSPPAPGGGLKAGLGAAAGDASYVLRAHTWEVNAVAVTADCRWAASGAHDDVINIWDMRAAIHSNNSSTGVPAPTPGPERTLHGHDFAVTALAVTPDGRRLVSGSFDDTLKLWDLASGADLGTLVGHDGGVNAVAVTPDGRWIVSGSSDRTLRLWPLHDPVAASKWAHENAPLQQDSPARGDGPTQLDAATEQDGPLVGEVGKSPRRKRHNSHILRGHSGRVWGVATFESDGAVGQPLRQDAATTIGIVSASEDGALKVWRLGQRTPIAEFKAEAPLSACAAIPGGHILLAGDTMGRVLVLGMKDEG